MSWQADPRTMVGGFLGAYHLDELLGQNELGPLFAATGNDAQRNRYLVRPLMALANPNGDAYAPYLDRFREQASAVAALQHPYILPLVDFGIAQGVPFLVWPQVTARSVSARLAQSGPVDVLTAGRYLDQIASALEYAHDRGILHLNLTTDCVQLQADGRVVVSDFGVWSMLQLGNAQALGYPLLGIGDAAAPELLLGAAPSPATDVYALGAALFRLLTAHPVFTAQTSEAAVQMHLNAPVPRLATWRPNMPPALDDILASAMAKQAGQRFQRPGALANAYHHIVTPSNSARVPFSSAIHPPAEATPFPSSPGMPRPVRAPSSAGHLLQASPSGTFRPLATPPGGVSMAPRSGFQTGIGSGFQTGTQGGTPSAARLRRAGISRSVLWTGVLGAVVVVTVLSLALLRGALLSGGSPASATGTATFGDSSAATAAGITGVTDTVTIAVHHLPDLPAGSYYYAWLVDTAHESTIFPLGTLSGGGGTYALTYSSTNANSAGGGQDTNLIGVGNSVKITQEHGAVNVPVGRVVLSGTWPAQAFQHIRHLLVSYDDTPEHVGLVTGLLEQAHVLDADVFAAEALANSHDPVVIQCSAQSILDILEGSQGKNYRPLDPACADHNITETGDGFGLLGENGYLSAVATHASAAATAPDATSFIRTHANHVRIATQNMTGWLTTVDRDAVALLNAPTNLGKLTEIVTLADRAYHGIPPSEDEIAAPVAGQAGALTAYEHTQFMATLTLAP